MGKARQITCRVTAVGERKARRGGREGGEKGRGNAVEGRRGVKGGKDSEVYTGNIIPIETERNEQVIDIHVDSTTEDDGSFIEIVINRAYEGVNMHVRRHIRRYDGGRGLCGVSGPGSKREEDVGEGDDGHKRRNNRARLGKEGFRSRRVWGTKRKARGNAKQEV
ncbi:hypothetical protein PM082_013948 [Marasmius tenuissimus]|nr:hypothetical protein PM082_013948 [Marasmius tenuissimus]